MIPVQKHLKAFEEQLILRNSPVKTRVSYLSHLKKYIEYCNANNIIDAFTDEAVKQYLLYRYSQKLDWKTVNIDYSAIKRYFTDVLNQEWNTQMFPRPKTNHELPDIISKEEVLRLIQNTTKEKYRVLFIFLYATGMRISEALAVRVKDIDSQRLQIKIHKGKGHKDRFVDIPIELIDILRDYYRAYRPVDKLFYGSNPQANLSDRTVQNALKRTKNKAGIIHEVTPHTLRHCYATHHMENGTNIVYIQKMLGHRNLKTTSIYLHLCVKVQSNNIIHPLTMLMMRLRDNTQT